MTTINNKEEKFTISKLGPFDVLCGRDKKCNNNAGNHQFRVLINSNLHRYMECTSKFERSKAISSISDELLNNPNGSIRFFKRVKGSDSKDCKNNDDDDPVEQLDSKKSHEKIAHALRDYAAQHRKNQEKHERSIAMQQQSMPQQNIVLQQPVNGNDEHAHRVTPQINNLTEQALIAQQQLSLENCDDRASMVSNNKAYGYNQEYVPPLNRGQNGQVQGVFETGDNPQRGLFSESNSRHLERSQGVIDGSISRMERMEEFSEFSESEGYDTFDPAPLTSGSSLRQMEGVERNGSHRSFGRTFRRNGSKSSINAQNSLRHVDLGPSARSIRSRDSIDEMSLLQTSMGTLSLGNSTMTGMSLEMGESTLNLATRPDMVSGKSNLDMGVSSLTLQTRPDMMSDKSKMDMGVSSLTLQTRPEMKPEISRLDMGESTFTLQTRPEMKPDISKLDMGESAFTLQSRPDLISERSRMEMSFEQPIYLEETEN